MEQKEKIVQLGKGRPSFLEAEVGQEIEPIEIAITEELVERNAWANDDYNPWYMEDSPFGGRIASPTLLALEADIMLNNHFTVPEGSGIMAKQEYEFINPLKVGSKVKMTCRVVDKLSKRGRDHFVYDFLVVDKDGLEIVRIRITLAFPLVARTEG